jgi:hypothetical protein
MIERIADLLDNSEHGGWWKAQIERDQFATSFTGKCPHRTTAVTGTPGDCFKLTCLSCGKISKTVGRSYTSDGNWQEPVQSDQKGDSHG